MFATPKRHIHAQNQEFWRILNQNPSRALGCSDLQEPPPQNNTFWFAIWHAKSRMHGNETPGRIVTNFCTGVVGGQILGFSIDLHRRPYNTRALPCKCVICSFYLIICRKKTVFLTS